MHHVLDVDEAAEPEMPRDADRVVDDVVLLCAFEPLRRIHGVRIAGVDARSFYVLHDAGDDHRLAVGDGVDLDLDPLQVFVDQDLSARHRANRPHHVAPELVSAANDLHRAAPEDVRGTHEHGVTGAFRDRFRLLDRRGRASHRLGDAYCVERASERAAILSEVDRLHARPEDCDLVIVERLGEVDRGLTAELDQRSACLLCACHVQRAVEVEGLEVQPVGRVEVGRYGLRVGVDHHRSHARLAQRPCGVHRAVVELDALADADGTRAHDQCGAPVNGGRLILLLPA